LLNAAHVFAVNRCVLPRLGLLIFLLISFHAGAEPSKRQVSIQLNGFEIIDPLVPVADILRGGPPRDGIPAIDNPLFTEARKADYLQPADRVIGVNLHGEQKAYPLRIMNYHEIVNDDFAGQPVVVSFCPLCGTGMAFSRNFAGQAVEFGVSGLLYNSDLLMYDRATKSLWSQLEGKAISGPLKGQRLESLAVQHTSWEAWLEQYPDSKVLSQQTGYQRDYSRNPYPGYQASAYVYFPVANMDRRYHPKEWVLGLILNDESKVYPFTELRAGPRKFADKVGGELVTILFDDDHNTVRVQNSEGKEISAVTAFWFAWMSFHPQSKVYLASAK
jgi:hypothetical protein